MRPSTSKQKGRQAEHDVIDDLQIWWRRVEPKAVFFRTPRSGGWSNAAATGMKTRGDLCYDPTTCSLFPFSVEVKHQAVVKQGSIARFVTGRPSTIDDFWDQCVKAARGDGLMPLLVFRGNRMPFRCAFMAETGERHVRLFETFLTYPPTVFTPQFRERVSKLLTPQETNEF